MPATELEIPTLPASPSTARPSPSRPLPSASDTPRTMSTRPLRERDPQVVGPPPVEVRQDVAGAVVMVGRGCDVAVDLRAGPARGDVALLLPSPSLSDPPELLSEVEGPGLETEK